jgi:hypothetical protein
VKRLRDSFFALLGKEEPETTDVVTERVRLAMLFAMDEHCTQEYVKLDVAIRFADDLTELWYLRPDLMHVLASCQGELTAQQVLRRITSLFKGHLSSANESRFGALQTAAR